MTRQSQRDFSAQRPVRSDFARRSAGGGGLNIGKVALLGGCVVAAMVGGYLFSLSSADSPATEDPIPTIQAEMPVKLRPDQPGGIDIPHQDVSVFQKLDNKSPSAAKDASGVEHLLPEPETPDMRTAPVKAAGPLVEPEKEPVLPAPSSSPEKERTVSTPQPQQETAKEIVDDLPPAITEATEAEPAPVKAEPVKSTEPVKKETAIFKAAAEKSVPAKKVEKDVKVEATAPAKADGTLGRLPTELFTQQDYAPPAAQKLAVVAETKTAPTSLEATSTKAQQIQLGSYPDEAAAQKEAKRLQNKYAGSLGGTSLRIVRADLGSKGIYYRVVSSSVAESKAKAICADIFKQKGNCIVVK